MKYEEVVAMSRYFGDGSESYFAIGEKGVARILYHAPDEIDNNHYCDVIYDDGSFVRWFNPSAIEGRNHISMRGEK